MVIAAASRRHARRLGRLRFAALVGVGTVLAHDAVFAAQHGLGDERDAALAVAAHEYWLAWALLVLLVGFVGLIAAVAALARLHRALRNLPRHPPARGTPGYAGELLRLWPRLFIAVTLTFALQENVEHVAAGQGLPGLGVLSWPAYPLALPVLGAVTLLLAAAGAWFRWRITVLEGRLAAARSAARRRLVPAVGPAARWGLVAAAITHARFLVRLDAGRAPPLGSGA